MDNCFFQVLDRLVHFFFIFFGILAVHQLQQDKGHVCITFGKAGPGLGGPLVKPETTLKVAPLQANPSKLDIGL